MKRRSSPVKRKAARKKQLCRAPRPGQTCPKCRRGVLDYDGLLQLTCPKCGYMAGGGGFT